MRARMKTFGGLGDGSRGWTTPVPNMTCWPSAHTNIVWRLSYCTDYTQYYKGGKQPSFLRHIFGASATYQARLGATTLAFSPDTCGTSVGRAQPHKLQLRYVWVVCLQIVRVCARVSNETKSEEKDRRMLCELWWENGH